MQHAAQPRTACCIGLCDMLRRPFPKGAFDINAGCFMPERGRRGALQVCKSLIFMSLLCTAEIHSYGRKPVGN